MKDKEIYTELSKITKSKEKWLGCISFVETFLDSESTKLKAKAIWIYGEIGLEHPEKITKGIPIIAASLTSDNPLIRSRALHALGRIGRADFTLVKTYLPNMLSMAEDKDIDVRVNFIWAAENIATNSPEVFENQMSIFIPFLEDKADKVRMEAPEIFRVMGKRIPTCVLPYLDKLKCLSENDSNRVVRIHAAGAIKATTRL